MADYLVDLGENERVVLEVRRHMFVFYTQIIWVVILFFLPLVFASPITTFLNDRLLETGGGILFTFLYLIWLLALFVIFFFQWTDYYLDVWVITTERIFDVEQVGMFNRTISVFRLEQIQDVTVEVHGILPTFLKYGNVHIHTAGEGNDFIIRDAENPLHIKKIIMEEHGRVMQTRTGRSGNPPASQLTQQ